MPDVNRAEQAAKPPSGEDTVYFKLRRGNFAMKSFNKFLIIDYCQKIYVCCKFRFFTRVFAFAVYTEPCDITMGAKNSYQDSRLRMGTTIGLEIGVIE